MDKQVKIFFDGGCRPNPGPMETAVVIRGATWLQQDAGNGTSELAEWTALVAAIALARDEGVARPLFLGDSVGVVRQANGEAPCRCPRTRALHEQFSAQSAAFEHVRVRHVGRHQNLAGIALGRARQNAAPRSLALAR